MKFALSILALVSVAYSQTITSEVAMLPTCALTCLAPAITAAGCGLTDYVCQCGPAKNAITQSATPCIISSCSADDALKTQSVAAQLCALAAGSGSSSAAGSATAASSATSRASSAATSASRAVSSASSRASTATAGTATTSAPATVTGAASREGVGAMVVGAALLAALAL